MNFNKFNTIHIPPIGHGGKADWETGARHVKAQPGIVVVETDLVQEEAHGLILSDQEAHQRGGTSGTVISSGHPGYMPGDHVCFLPFTAQIIFTDYSEGDYRASGLVRFIGLAVESIHMQGRLSHKVEVSKIMPFTICGQEVTMKGENLLVEREADVEDRNGLLLPDAMRFGRNKGVVVAAPDAYNDFVGKKVQYDGASTVPGFMRLLDPSERLGEKRDLIVAPVKSILAVLE